MKIESSRDQAVLAVNHLDTQLKETPKETIPNHNTHTVQLKSQHQREG
jgi:hypothetical protein